MYRMYGIPRCHGWQGAAYYRMYGQKIAPRQMLLHCSNKLHPCNDAFSALPPPMAVVCRGAMDGKERRITRRTVYHKETGGLYLKKSGVIEAYFRMDDMLRMIVDN